MVLTKNWGDITEPCLAAALKYIYTGSFGGRFSNNEEEQKQAFATQKTLEPLSKNLNNKKFTGMFFKPGKK